MLTSFEIMEDQQSATSLRTRIVPDFQALLVAVCILERYEHTRIQYA